MTTNISIGAATISFGAVLPRRRHLLARRCGHLPAYLSINFRHLLVK
jgi:hypothetical protein